jgi:peptidoglycan/xylan/chitin deacetylase (PgdA/CDA1 family)
MSPYEFQRQVEYLRKKYTIVSLNEIMDFVEGKRGLPKKTVAITFDDGYDDNYFVAYPYLRRYDLPATIFVATDFNQKTTLADGRTVFAKMLSWNEIKEMSQNGITIGAHTLTHRDLMNMDLEEIRKEIFRSKEEIERQIGKRVDYFAYPFGRYNDETLKLVRTLGFRGAFGGIGTIQQGANVFDLKRIPVYSSDTFLMFSVKLTRATDWVTKIARIVRPERVY